MSNDLFINAEKELERLESLLQIQKRYVIGLTAQKSPPALGKTGIITYAAQLAYTRPDGTTDNFSVEGKSFPELFKNISDKIS